MAICIPAKTAGSIENLGIEQFGDRYHKLWMLTIDAFTWSCDSLHSLKRSTFGLWSAVVDESKESHVCPVRKCGHVLRHIVDRRGRLPTQDMCGQVYVTLIDSEHYMLVTCTSAL